MGGAFDDLIADGLDEADQHDDDEDDHDADVGLIFTVDVHDGKVSQAARADRAGVLISLPLALCFLPAFIVLGLVPIVVSLSTQML